MHGLPHVILQVLKVFVSVAHDSARLAALGSADHLWVWYVQHLHPRAGLDAGLKFAEPHPGVKRTEGGAFDVLVQQETDGLLGSGLQHHRHALGMSHRPGDRLPGTDGQRGSRIGEAGRLDLVLG